MLNQIMNSWGEMMGWFGFGSNRVIVKKKNSYFDVEFEATERDLDLIVFMSLFHNYIYMRFTFPCL